MRDVYGWRPDRRRPVVQDPHVDDVLARGGTLVYRRSGVPLRRAWMRVVEGRAQRAHGVPGAGARQRDRARSRRTRRRDDGRRAVPKLSARRCAWVAVRSRADRSLRLRGLPQGRCRPVALCRSRIAYAVDIRPGVERRRVPSRQGRTSDGRAGSLVGRLVGLNDPTKATSSPRSGSSTPTSMFTARRRQPGAGA
jgi:hypothetical protein